MTRKIFVDAEDVETGEHAVVECPDSVDFGATFRADGRRYRRLVTAPKVRVTNNRFLSHKLPREEHTRDGKFTRAPHYVDGVAAFSTLRERQEYDARHNDNPAHGDRLEWDA